MLLETQGGQTVFVTGSGLGIDPADIVVNYIKGNVILRTTGCAVLIPNAKLACVTSAGVGFGFVWHVSVDGAWARAPEEFTTSYNLPVVLDSQRQIGTNGLAVFELSGHNFGPAGTRTDRAYLYSPVDPAVVFYAHQCNVVADTSIVCSVPDGAGTTLLWTVVIGGQASAAPTVAYPVPQISSVLCNPAPCGALNTSGAETGWYCTAPTLVRSGIPACRIICAAVTAARVSCSCNRRPPANA